MTIERIKDFKEIILPFFTNYFLKENYENLGKSDAEEYEKDFNEILNLAAKALEQQPITDVSSNVLHKIAEFFSNWDGDENAKMEISVNDMREISSMYITNCRAKSKEKALKQESCVNAISQRAVLDVVFESRKNFNSEFDQGFFVDKIRDLPLVQPKMGHWIYDKRIENWKCSECGRTPKTIGYVGRVEFMREHFKFCNHCGARMIKLQTESEEV